MDATDALLDLRRTFAIHEDECRKYAHRWDHYRDRMECWRDAIRDVDKLLERLTQQEAV